MKRWIGVAIAAALVAGGCSEVDAGEGSANEKREIRKEDQRLDRAQKNTREVAEDVCGHGSPARIARELGLPPGANPHDIATEYSLGSTSEHRDFAYSGCYEGLVN